MKKLTLLFAGIFAFANSGMARGNHYSTVNSYADAFVFDEMGITFSVYPDGEFDFYLPGNQQSTTVSNGYVNVTFNSGYDYSPYVQYDDFGAVIQVENVPVWYDYYGRVNQIGDVRISYRDQRVCQVGGLYVHYNSYGHYAYHTGFINTWNPYFVYRPFYACFARPVVNLCFVRLTPYRQYYTPVRYTYYRPYVHNVRPCYATIGHTYRPSGYGQAHHRYTQTAGRGEMAFSRSRRTITTADASPKPLTTGRESLSNSRSDAGSRYSHSEIGSRSATGASNVRQSNPTSVSSRTAPSSSDVRRPVTSQPRTVQSAPARTNSSTRVAPSTSSSRPAITTQTRSNASSGAVSRPSTSTSTRQAAPSRGSVSTAPSNSRTSPARIQPSSSSRGAVSKPAASSPSRVTSSQPSRSSVQTPSRSAAPPQTRSGALSSSKSKGTVSKSSSASRGN
ncbi:MAG: hypothetical protein K9G41_10130 [Flavobacteriales bacterium]|nr:hypothetical protein [Flavobacteriales bacterium]